MKFKSVVCLLCIVLGGDLFAKVIDTRDIDKVRSKPVLQEADLQIIDNFVAEVVAELVDTKDFTSISKIRAIILNRKSDQAQYAEQFSQSAYKYINLGFKKIDGLENSEQKFRSILNLLIVIHGLEDVKLLDLTIPWLNYKNRAVRYWAVRCVTNPNIFKQLNLNPQKKELVIDNLEKMVKTADAETSFLIAEFAAKINTQNGDNLLLKVVDMRIKGYADWTVDYEIMDISILKSLYDNMILDSGNKTAVARRFAQLYSYVIQRYVKGQEILNAVQKQQLASVMVEIENTYIGKILELPQSVIKRAVEQKDFMALMEEHGRLLGVGGKAGQLELKLNFDYGVGSDGSKLLAPLPLPKP